MLIELDDSLAGTRGDIGVSAALETLGLSSFRGAHVLHGSISALKWALEHPLGQAAAAAFKRALSRVASRSSLVQILDVRIAIVPAGQELVRDGAVWRLPIDLVTECALTSCDLLAENLKDAEAYIHAARHVARLIGLVGARVSISPQNGGGSQIAAAMTQAIAARAFTLAITDSDKLFPGASPSAVSEACRGVAEEQRWVAEHFELGVREIENLLPINLLSDSIDGDRQSADVLPRFKRLLQLYERDPNIWSYIDLKLGQKGYRARGRAVPELERLYWSRLLERSPDLCSVNCGACEVTNDLCGCTISDGLGDGVLKRFLEHCSGISVAKQLERVKTSPNKDGWLEVGRVAMSWGIADEPYRA